MACAISIIIPVFNVAPYLPKCMDSILSQTFTDFEAILVDDGSDDGSSEICEAYAKKDSRVCVLHKPNGGLSSARNAGLEIAQGEYISFVDSDDYIDIEMLKIMHDVLQKEEADIAVCKFIRELDGKCELYQDSMQTKVFDNSEGLRELFRGKLYRFSACNKIYRRSCFFAIRFPENRIHEDLSTTYKVFAKASKVVYVDYSGYIYVKRQGSILTSTYNEKRLQAFQGWDEILTFMMNDYPFLKEEVLTSFSYACMDHANYITSGVKDLAAQKHYLSRIRQSISPYKYDVLGSRLAIKYKFIMALLGQSTKGYLYLSRLRRGV